MTHLTSSILTRCSRLQESLAKRLVWRRHLEDARQELTRLRAELPTVEMMVTIPCAFRGRGHYRTLGLKQNMLEIRDLANRLQEHPLRNVCEIGTYKGGTLFIWCQLAAPDARIFSIDLPGGQFGGGYNKKSLPLFQSFCQPGQTLKCIRGNSHDSSVRDDFARQLDGSELDFLFIDGDHTYEGVKDDFEQYSPFVRSGGLIAFHDIRPRPELPHIQVHRLWEDLKRTHRHEEFVDTSPGRRHIGIGLIYKE